MNSIQPILSIVTIVFHNAPGLLSTYKSLRQALEIHPDWEWIIVDSSKDAHSEVYREIQTKYQIYEQAPQGIYAAINLGTEKARGEIVWHLHASDILWDTDQLEQAIETLRSSRNYWLTSPMMRIYSKEDIRMAFVSSSLPAMLGSGNGPYHPGSLFKTEIFKTIGYFKTSYKIAADIELFVRLFHKNWDCLVFQKPFVGFDMHGLSQRQPKISWSEFREITKSLQLSGIHRWTLTFRVYFHQLRLHCFVPILRKLGLYQITHQSIERLKKLFASRDPMDQ